MTALRRCETGPSPILADTKTGKAPHASVEMGLFQWQNKRLSTWATWKSFKISIDGRKTYWPN